ncbi:MAG: YibE/F family protein [Solirubrobacteraceae bacterium]
MNTEAVATQVVATLVGSIGLIVAVPITTALAGLLAMRLPADVLSAEAEHAHAH